MVVLELELQECWSVLCCSASGPWVCLWLNYAHTEPVGRKLSAWKTSGQEWSSGVLLHQKRFWFVSVLEKAEDCWHLQMKVFSCSVPLCWKQIHSLQGCKFWVLGRKRSISSEINLSWRNLRALKNQVVVTTSGIQNQAPHIWPVFIIFLFFLLLPLSSGEGLWRTLNYEETILPTDVDKPSCFECSEISGVLSHKTWNWSIDSFGWFCSGVTFALCSIQVIMLLLLTQQ